MPLVLGIDSSTQSTKVELRDAETGELSARVGRRTRDVAAAQRAGPRGLAGRPRRGPPRRPGATGRRPWPSPRSSTGSSCSTTRRGDPSRQAVERHRVGARRRHGSSTARRRPRRGPRRAVRCRSPSFTISKLSWLHRSEPENFARIARVLLPHDWLTFRLTGGFTTDRGDASGTGYWSAAEGQWRTDLLAIVDAGERLGRVPPRRARAHGGRARARGDGDRRRTGDNMAAALGARARARRRRDLARHVGHGVHGQRRRRPPIPTGRRRLRRRHRPVPPPRVHAQRDQVTDDVRAAAPRRPTGASTGSRSAAPPGAGGLVLLPYLDGERTPEPARRDRHVQPDCAAT